jgi:hypothetical protein
VTAGRLWRLGILDQPELLLNRQQAAQDALAVLAFGPTLLSKPSDLVAEPSDLDR